MAGLEVAGLVLGALPIAINAVQRYRETFYSIKNVKRELGYIERDLRTEKLRLQNTCEALLVGIVAPTKIHSMIEDPFGPDWKSYAEPLQFEECIMDMSEATQQFKLQLGIEDGSQINLRDRASILEAFKQNATFTLKKKEYEGILSRIKADNTVLQDLSRVSRELELDRRRRSQSRLTKLLRGLFQSIYSALCSAITCACVYSHSIGLQLAHRDVIILPLDVEEKVAERFDFCITLRTLEAGNEYKTMRIGQPVNEAQLVSHWENFQLRLMHAEKLPLTSTTLLLTSATPSPKPKVSWASSVSFMLSNTAPHTVKLSQTNRFDLI
ncbi:hypothetical protein F4801DRAFT_575571 [Xylaria longipes]|nr:hypothetical protein F4801DRAFT_575571 [Xylaria longipes]